MVSTAGAAAGKAKERVGFRKRRPAAHGQQRMGGIHPKSQGNLYTCTNPVRSAVFGPADRCVSHGKPRTNGRTETSRNVAKRPNVTRQKQTNKRRITDPQTKPSNSRQHQKRTSPLCSEGSNHKPWPGQGRAAFTAWKCSTVCPPEARAPPRLKPVPKTSWGWAATAEAAMLTLPAQD